MKRIVLLLIILSLNITTGYSQETSKYQGLLKGGLLIESIELYSNGTFKWTSEYDLSWSENGTYELNKDSLILSYDAQSPKTEEYLIKELALIKLDEKGKQMKWRKEKSIKTRWSWIYGHRFKYEIRKTPH